VYGRPLLAVARASLDSEIYGTILTDRRGIKLCAERLRGLTIVRPLEPFSWLALSNPAIKVCHLVADLCGERDPLAAWRTLPYQRCGFLFNYARELR
ncbi:MAG: hypothetical protein N3A66_06710, partial [Planctomycetota bacterium]|nr:hypothetical protein [Planctomycetota bacterium]